MSIAQAIGKLFSGISRVFAFARVTLANLLVILVVAGIIAVFAAGPGRVDVSQHSALLVEPDGAIVEQAASQDPLLLLSGGVFGETRLADILASIEKAGRDDRVGSLVLDTSSLAYAAPAQLEVIGNALEAFRAGGKKIIAKSHFYDRDQYYLASFADKVVMHPLGEVMLDGYGTFRSYYGGLFERLKVNVHVFRVGTYKAFVEPYTRAGMSDAAKQANQAIIDALWKRYVEQVAANRGLEPATVAGYAQRYDELLLDAGGDTARLALQYGLVDELLDNQATTAQLADLTGGEGAFSHVAMADYLDPMLPPMFGKTVAVIPMSGTILMGDQPRGFIGSNTATRLLRDAREDPAVVAVVLRIDSGGGSAFASELIRQEVGRVQEDGKPVVVSMGGTAASGGYWIAATADEIWAAPTTLTGSIGIFAMVPTFEDTLAQVGVTRDGVGTGPLVGALDPFGGVGDAMGRVLQASVDDGYRRFVDLVAQGRGLSPSDVEAIAQGRVWLGEQALDHGLVDHLGHLDDAIASAAEAAGLEQIQVRYVEEPLSAQEMLLRQLLNSAGVTPPRGHVRGSLTRTLVRELNLLDRLNDPKHVYALCEGCPGAM